MKAVDVKTFAGQNVRVYTRRRQVAIGRLVYGEDPELWFVLGHDGGINAEIWARDITAITRSTLETE